MPGVYFIKEDKKDATRRAWQMKGKISCTATYDEAAQRAVRRTSVQTLVGLADRS